MQIGERASLTQVDVQTIRFYEKDGLLTELLGTDSGYRVYGQPLLERPLSIRHCCSLGMSLADFAHCCNYAKTLITPARTSFRC